MSSVARWSRKTFSERLVDFANEVRYQRVETGQEREAVFRLRYEAYVREGTIPISFSKRFSDTYDETRNVWIFGTYINDELVSSIRIHVASPDRPISPSMDVFPDVLLPEIEKGHTVVDPTRFVIHPAIARRYPELPYITVRLGFLASEYFQADLGLASVRVEHQAFYKRLFLMSPLCEPRVFPNLTKLFSLMGVNYPSVRDRIIQRHPFMKSSMSEMQELFGRADAEMIKPLKLAQLLSKSRTGTNAEANHHEPA